MIETDTTYSKIINGNEHEPTYDDWLDFGLVAEAAKNGEYGSALLFAMMFEGQFCYDHTDKKWFLWTGSYWEPDKRNSIVNELVKSLSAQYAHGDAIASKQGLKWDSDQRKALFFALTALRQRSGINNILALATSQPKLALSGDEWDHNPWLLGCANGVIDLKTGSFNNAIASDYIRTVAPTEFTCLDEPCPKWEKFLFEVFNGDSELIEFMQRLLGYSLVGEVIEHILPVLVGEEGRNGKSLMLNVLRHVLGDYAGPAAEEVLLSGKNSPGAAMPYVAALRFKRLVYVSETNEGDRLNAGTVKLLTGGDELMGRNLYGNPFTFLPRHTAFLVTNNKPHAPSNDSAIWERLHLIEFTQRFIDDPTEPNEHARDPYLFQKLETEAAGILAWLVRGCLQWQDQGLNPPQSVKSATEAYRQDEDDLGRFIEERCLINEDEQIKASVFYQSYKSWSKDEGLKPMTGTKFGKRMSKRFTKEKKRNGAFYFGVSIRPIEIDETSDREEKERIAMEKAFDIMEKNKQG